MPYKTFGFTDEQVLMRDNALGLLQRVLPPSEVEALERDSAYPLDAYKALARDGWLALPFDEEYGGAKAGYKDLAVLIEALGYHHNGIRSAYMTSVIYGGMHIQANAAEEIKREFLPKIIAGELRMAIGYTEPQSGSDAAGIKTRAVRDGDDYVLNGQKVYITNAHHADYIVFTAKTDPDAGLRGISLFLVDAKSQGVDIHTLDALGCRTSLPNEIFLDNVRVPARNMLGGENEGWKRLMHGLNLERVLLSASGVGQCFKIIEVARNFLDGREAFGQPISEFQAVSHKFADMLILTEAARQMTFHTADMLDAGADAVVETAIAKTLASESNWKVADLGMQIMGAAGYMQGEMQRMFADARQGTIGGGSSEVMRNVIAKRMGL
ncbi:MAG: acyl-CoA/acyl-ACP dehydrogenase [Rhodospirillaceae bacterium]|jgi:alkylation response protein AidB-like acyl-CoA dehydrogenase|nr:acyl-CoA/acyl-ACP dehydrogenase [Rhodospirillaceae bacterium]MBT5666903.1 acyl-CoA/acyl-ACP dehydrogenase [Rhodospirillaceae bacterium]MBT5812224.1 acyl-CoA/acyl-ACP dehydrogenase [Rhodospirillaceae bacterium]